MNNARRNRTVHKFIIEAKSVPCADCQQTYPYYVMQFDHVRGQKVANVGRLLRSHGLAVIMEEVAKCEVVCANCHAIRSYERLETQG